MNKFGFSFKFSLLFAFVFFIEVLIAVFFDDLFIRPFVGDVLVVILLYLLVRMVSKFEHLHVVIGVLLFAYIIEFSQYLNLISLLNLQDIKLARIIIGTTYDGMDLVAYSLGALILFISTIKNQKQLFTIGFFTLIAATIISLTINFIPTWEKIEVTIIFSLFFITAIVWLIFLINIWVINAKNRNSLNIIDWIKSIIFSFFMIAVFYFFFLISILSMGQGFMGPTLDKEFKIQGIKIFLYTESCFIPDGACECSYYHSLIFVKNNYLPIMHLKKKVDFYVGDIRLNNGKLVIIASEMCAKDWGKKLELNYGG